MKKHHGKKAGHHHTGEMHRGSEMHLESHPGHDQHASAEHHKHNKEHGMGLGFCPEEEYCNGHEPGLGGMAANESFS